MRLITALENLQRHPVLRKLTLNDVVQYARLVGHLKNDILLPQPLEQTDPGVPPDVLPLSLVEFLSLALSIKQEFIQDSWDIMKYYIWECTTVPLIHEDFELFREFGWSRGIAVLSIYPRESVCATVGCGNTRPLKKETSREVVVYTTANGVQAAWAIHLYCPGKSYPVDLLAQLLNDPQSVKLTITTTLLSMTENAHTTKKSHFTYRLANINSSNRKLSAPG
ncbi:uncharacterized protein LACBIDRAFT_321423 [Laccaria bicolor S238N-H82]|uniref:Predicted protein n=1 Tax=Laccaria bicolor (strain S238N-H82 / ATCC MYA-4686) TaxID=486041 RepID=B0CQB6_LACBS|nr:uncharacterized protein LACBIDRAFT_321423 [Laccaria bicolor S238N-H82]EDR16177.1 predicted protein [Laccaria bicolor S238N-H82]|eukprot:XP_001874385.1 predicted protein [Laccaria bicolor S238N-H82]